MKRILKGTKGLLLLLVVILIPQCVSAETVYRERYKGGPYENTPQELNVEGNELYYAKLSGYKSIDEFSESEKVTLYAGGNRTLTIPNFLKETYLNLGWFERPVTTLYTLDGRKQDFPDEEVEAQCSVGWYREKPILLYTLDGRQSYFLPGDVEAQLGVGWFRKPPVVLYTLDGRSEVFPGEYADEQRKVGWYYKTEIDEIRHLEELASSFSVGQRVWMNKWAYYPVGYVVSVKGTTVDVIWEYICDYDWYRIYNQNDIKYAEMYCKLELGEKYSYSADDINKYK